MSALPETLPPVTVICHAPRAGAPVPSVTVQTSANAGALEAATRKAGTTSFFNMVVSSRINW